MKFGQSFKVKLWNDFSSRRFSDPGDLTHYVQNGAGKFDSKIIISYWSGQEHMINDELRLSIYIKFEYSR